MKNDLISREKLKRAIETYDKFACLPDGKIYPVRELKHPEMFIQYIHVNDVIKAIDNAPTEKAEWIYCGVWSEGIGPGQVFGDKVKCSNCMTEYRFTHRFCPYCGRRMKNGKL